MATMRVVLVLCLMLGVIALANAAGPTLDQWRRHRDAVTKDPDVVRYYTFEQIGAADAAVPSLVGGDAPLRYGTQGPPGPEEVNPRLVDGRLPEKKAVRLDRGILSAPQFPVANKTFSVAAWVRTHGQGSVPGDVGPQSGTLLSQGNGYWDGWRITLSYPDRTIGFELGKRPGAEQLRTGPVADGVWHYLVATWDGQAKRLYVDGALAAEAAYTGDHAVPEPNATFRLGYANAGWGSVVTDYDEVAIHRRALTPEEVLQGTLYHAPASPGMLASLAAADASASVEGYRGLLKTTLDPHWAAAVRLRLGQAYLKQNRPAEALRELAPVLEVADLPEGMRAMALTPLVAVATQSAVLPADLLEKVLRQADFLPARERLHLRLSLARSFAQAGNAEAAAREIEAVRQMSELSPQETRELTLQMGHAFAQGSKHAAARQHYQQLATDPEAPAHYRAYAMLCVAWTHTREKQYRPARAAYEQVRQMPDAPGLLKWEAEDCLREIARLEKKLPARDPQWGRVALPKWPHPGRLVYVSPRGKDTSPGTKDKPMATLQGAQALVRALKQKGLPKGGVVVSLAPGEYRMTEALAFGPEDSGTKTAPVVWRAEKPGTAVLSGGEKLSGFTVVTDEALLSRLPEEARGKVVQCDVRALGITSFDEPRPRGMGGGQAHPIMELFCDGKPMRPARWPNEGFAHVKSVISYDDSGAVFEYEGDQPARWAQAKDPWYFGYPKWLWADQRDPIMKADPTQRRIHVGGKFTYGGFDGGTPFYVYNLLEEMDQPGEWYLDREAGVLYLYPPGDMARAEARLSMLETEFVRTEGASWLALEGLVMEYGRWNGVRVRDGDHVLVAGCTVRNIGGDGITIEGGREHGIFGCHLYNLGRGGARLAGGDRKTLTPGGHFIENCQIHDFSRVDRTYTPAVWLDGVGNRIAHNSFHDSPCHAMRIEGNDHVLEFNDVYRVVLESDDQGGVDMWGNAGYRGVIIRYNYWHDIASEFGLGQAGIRLDDAICEVWVYGNVFQRCAKGLFGGVQIHGGKENMVANNVFADLGIGVSFSGWGEGGWRNFLASDFAKQRLYQEVDITKPPYSARYPALARLAEGEGINSIWRNVATNCAAFLARDRGLQDLMDNLVTLSDPGFVAAEKGDFTIKPGSALLRTPAFRPIPFDEIGQYAHPLRAR